jgi:hypothetical protein
MSDAPEIMLHRECRLVVCRPEGQLDAGLAARLLDFLLAMEDADPEPFDRLLDLTAVAEIRLSGPELYRFAQLRRAATARRRPFQTAILAPNPLAYGMGRMYEMLMEGSTIRVGVFREAAGAADWLGAPRAVVEPSHGLAQIEPSQQGTG